MMAQAKSPEAVKLFIGVIFADEDVLSKAKQNLVRKFGLLDFTSPTIPFNCTNYYEKEMGTRLLRQFFSFQRLINPESLAAIKLFTNRLEKRFSLQKDVPSRRINLDPGYICTSKLVLATCKNYSHRIYLGKGIYAEVTLHFQKGTFTPWPWTYPDYQSAGYIQTFNQIRQLYLKQVSR